MTPAPSGKKQKSHRKKAGRQQSTDHDADLRKGKASKPSKRKGADGPGDTAAQAGGGKDRKGKSGKKSKRPKGSLSSPAALGVPRPADAGRPAVPSATRAARAGATTADTVLTPEADLPVALDVNVSRTVRRLVRAEAQARRTTPDEVVAAALRQWFKSS